MTERDSNPRCPDDRTKRYSLGPGGRPVENLIPRKLMYIKPTKKQKKVPIIGFIDI